MSSRCACHHKDGLPPIACCVAEAGCCCALQKQRAAALAVRVGAVKDELAALLIEVEREGSFFGSFHAANGLRQARTYTNDCLVRLMELADGA